MNLTKNFRLIFLLFFIAFGLIIYLQYVSYSTSKSLIKSNEDLAEEMDFSNNIQFFQTHLILLDNHIDEIRSGSQSESIKDLERELKILNLTYNYINIYLSIQNTKESTQDFRAIFSQKIELGQNVLDQIKNNGNLSPQLINQINQKEDLNENINSKLIDWEDLASENVLKKSESIIQSEKLSQSINLWLTLLSCLIFGLAIYFIYNQIQKQRHLISELKIAQEKAIKLSKVKDDFLANMSHEIRTPLNGILGFIEILRMESISQKAQKIIQTIQDASHQLLFIVNQILDISKIEEGMVRIEKTPFQLSEVIAKLDASYRDLIESKNIKFLISNESGTNFQLKGDQYRLIQILSNLLSNSLKFTSEGEINLKIKSYRLDSKQNLQFILSDTGIGIESHKLTTIFERFEQAALYTTRTHGGSGLGLSIVKQLVDLHEGTIEVESKINQGSKFIVSIPFEIYQESESKFISNTYEKIHKINSNAKILVVEDNPINLKLIRHWFEGLNLKFHYSVMATSAIEILKKEQFDLILMDIQLPEMNGYQCTEYIRQELKISTPILGITAHTMKTDIDKCFESGMNAYLMKPLYEAILIKTMHRFISLMDTKLVDLENLNSISNGNSSFVSDFLKEFLYSTPIEIDKLNMSYQTDNLADFKFVAHSLKTNFSYLGLKSDLLLYFESMEAASDLHSHQNDLHFISYLYELTKNEIESLKI